MLSSKIFESCFPQSHQGTHLILCPAEQNFQSWIIRWRPPFHRCSVEFAFFLSIILRLENLPINNLTWIGQIFLCINIFRKIVISVNLCFKPLPKVFLKMKNELRQKLKRHKSREFFDRRRTRHADWLRRIFGLNHARTAQIAITWLNRLNLKPARK